ncbi:MAG: putative aminohydrolase SsnA [Chloroflexota bacterium]
MMLLTNVTLVNWTPRQLEADQAVLVRDGVIADIGVTADLIAQYPDAERYDARGKLLMPGNLCAHTHFYGAFSRGLAIPGAAARDFPEILRKLWWPLDKALTLEDVRLSALVSLVDAVKHGTTTLIDHHASPNAIAGSLDSIAGAVEQSGLRAVLCYEVSDRDGVDKAQAGIAENVRFLRASKAHPTIGATFGLHASLTLSEATLQACVEANAEFGGGFHIHIAEHEADQEDSLAKSGLRAVHRLEWAGILGPRTIAAHAVHVDPWELHTLRATGTWVTHQPRSNMNNAVGAAAFEAMLQGGVKLCLGNDGFSNNMWAEWKAAYLLHKVAHRDPRLAGGDEIVQVACDHNARLAETFFPGQTLGKLALGAAADLILVEYYPFTPLTAGNLAWHILFGFESSMVTATIVAGRVLMWDRQLRTLDEAAIAAEALARVPAVWARYAEYATST